MMRTRTRDPLTLLAALAAASLCPVTAGAAPASASMVFTTLGTNSGPIPNAQRAEPANLIRLGDEAILVDVGDGAGGQLAKAGVTLAQVRTIFISHLHFDHTGGLFAFLGERYQARYLDKLTIYGPPGTKQMVDTLEAAMLSGVEVSTTIRGPTSGSVSDDIKVVEIGDGSKVTIGALTVTAVANSHFATLPPAAPGTTPPISLSFRFDAPGRSVVYTGDTGPSENVERLCRGADLLVSEIMDPVAAMEVLKATRLDVPDRVLKVVEAHFRTEHLAPTEVGVLAQRCEAKALVLTHYAIADDAISAAQAAIAASYKGPITFAKDVDSF
ncbi:MAG: MBL fold metallo-hydrolase [bacterium]|nr:MBL fold metallo-hydrolase [bacterium]